MATLVIGYGNPLRQDDGLGWEVARQVDQLFAPARIEALTCHQLTPELAELVSRADLVIFIDARDGDGPGRVECHPVIARPDGDSTFSHHLSPSTLLGLARSLYGGLPPAWLVSVDGASFGYGSELSPKVRAALPGVVACVRDLVDGEPARARE